MASHVKKTWNGRAVIRRVHQAAGDGNTASADVLLAAALDRVPRDTNDLANTGAVSTEDDGRTAAVSFGTDHAAVQHEDLTLEHPGGGEAKFLEGPSASERPAMAKAAAGRMRALLRR
ncbi:hypothetical protein LO763_22860 [Glycomyces sp. A-F 0318]|uniref:hypothetical protein n=1 Tax=Glycomyces amatae TaxID=2881355 RepID=UPI001E4771C3|nr:hypothetical protein [Glycomyces amatae]MCD0446461.1 hypothetical protein [Glycomyces amatae]